MKKYYPTKYLEIIYDVPNKLLLILLKSKRLNISINPLLSLSTIQAVEEVAACPAVRYCEGQGVQGAYPLFEYCPIGQHVKPLYEQKLTALTPSGRSSRCGEGLNYYMVKN